MVPEVYDGAEVCLAFVAIRPRETATAYGLAG